MLEGTKRRLQLPVHSAIGEEAVVVASTKRNNTSEAKKVNNSSNAHLVSNSNKKILPDQLQEVTIRSKKNHGWMAIQSTATPSTIDPTDAEVVAVVEVALPLEVIDASVPNVVVNPITMTITRKNP